MTLADKEFKQLMERRRFEPARTGLEGRIIASARPVRQWVGASAWLGEIFDNFLLPKPAVALAATLALGLAIGFGAPRPLAPGAEDALIYPDDNGVTL